MNGSGFASTLGDIIRHHRKAGGLTQVELATLAGVGKTVVFDMEQGKESVQLDTLLKVLRVLNIELIAHSPLMKTWREGRDDA